MLHDVLSGEQLALEKRDVVELEKSSNEKNKMVKQINAHELPPLIDHRGITISSLSDFKQHCINDGQLKKGWNDLMSLVEKCNFKNEVNGRLISLLDQSSRRTINLIKGFDPDNNIYNATGSRSMVRHSGGSVSA